MRRSTIVSPVEGGEHRPVQWWPPLGRADVCAAVEETAKGHGRIATWGAPPRRSAATFLEHFYAEGGKSVVVSGGEPLITKKLKKILEINPKADIRLLTNATMIDEKWAAYLSKFNISIQVSIDGSNKSIHDSIRGDGSFEAAITGVEHLIRQGMQKRINFLLP